ncbi:MAG: hypothetical protein A2W11_03730 [Ignavibacteria bacterium RBG_16_35_7]|nr:MAG: hypothetical protein A2W11_03730 [Ignavibacteria bacterium RBG_16_35_7]
MNPIKIYTGITNGLPQDLKSLELAFQHFEGVGVDITIERHKTKRSNQQNKYLWSVVWNKIVDFIFDLTGKRFVPQDIHDNYVKLGYFGYKESPVDVNIKIPKGSSEATTIEFMEAVSRIQMEWAEKGLVIPDPNQKDFINDKIEVQRAE